MHIPGLKCNGASHPGKSGRNRIAVICMSSQHLTLLQRGHAMNNMHGKCGLDFAARVACHERTGALCSRLQERPAEGVTRRTHTCLYRQKHTMASTSPTMSSLLSILNALAISLLFVLVRLLACRPCVGPTNIAELGPLKPLMQAFVSCLSAAHLAFLHLQVMSYIRDM